MTNIIKFNTLVSFVVGTVLIILSGCTSQQNPTNLLNNDCVNYLKYDANCTTCKNPTDCKNCTRCKMLQDPKTAQPNGFHWWKLSSAPTQISTSASASMAASMAASAAVR